MKGSRLYRRQLLWILLLLCAALVLKLLKLTENRGGKQPENGQEESSQGEQGQKAKLFILGTSENVDGLAEDLVLTDQGVFRTRLDVSGFPGRRAEAELSDKTEDGYEVISGIRALPSEEFWLNNVYILDARPDGLTVLIENYPVRLAGAMDGSYDYEHVADICLTDGAVHAVRIKKETIRGRILSVYDDKIELEGYGVLPLSEDFRIYEDYETPRELDASRLVVGYDIAEFIAADGMICAGIVKAPPDMTRIRVVIGRTGYTGLMHEEIRIVPEGDVTMVTGDGEEKIPAGEELVFRPEYLDMEERIRLIPDEEDGRMKVLSVERSLGNPEYSGILEVNRREDGLLLVNEVGLEVYLCSVVPSEMPSSYEPEALKAQAVCARSYAFCQIRESRYQAYGAHVDDSVSSQVYNNVPRTEASTRAVYDTAGEVAVYDNEVITAYYFSTSCGCTTSAEVWGRDAQLPYLKSRQVSDENGTDYESGLSWYRWSTAGNGEAYRNGILMRVSALAQSAPETVKVKRKDGSYGDGAVPTLGDITDIREGERMEGGALFSLYIDGTKGSVRIDTEYAVRKVLCESGMEILRQDESTVKAGTLLPSAFFVLTREQKDGMLNTLRIEGGGYGHGVGLSQNGANAMAAEGKGYQEILKFFYDGIAVEKMKDAF